MITVILVSILLVVFVPYLIVLFDSTDPALTKAGEKQREMARIWFFAGCFFACFVWFLRSDFFLLSSVIPFIDYAQYVFATGALLFVVYSLYFATVADTKGRSRLSRWSPLNPFGKEKER